MYENGKLIDTRYVQSLIYDEENDKIIYEVDQDNIPVYTVPVDDDTKKPSVIIQKS